MAKTAQIRALLGHLETGDLSSGLLSEIASKLVEHVEFVSDLDDLEGAELLGVAVDVNVGVWVKVAVGVAVEVNVGVGVFDGVWVGV